MSRRLKFENKRYRPTKLLGQGGMGRVVLADDLELGREVAIKIMSSHLRENEGAFARFRREARIQARVEHPNVIKLYDWDLDSKTPYLVMEVVRGEDLDEVLKKGGTLGPEALLRMAREVGSGMDALHREGVLHRDMKPSNIMVREDGSAVVMDLGLAKAEDVTVLTQTGAMVGTPRFMPPEVFMGERKWDARSDQFQLGAILFQAATGEHYIPGENLQELGAALQAARFRAFPLMDPPLPEGMRAAILRAAAPDPDRRFDTCGELAEAMGAEPGKETLEVLAELEAEPAGEGAAMYSGELGPRPERAPRRGRAAVFGFAALLAVGLGLGWTTAEPAPEPKAGAASSPIAEEGAFGAKEVARIADEIAALRELRIQDGKIVDEGGAALFAVRPDPAVLLQVLPRMPTVQEFHRLVVEGQDLTQLSAATMAGLRDLDRDVRGRGLPQVFHPATREPPAPEPFRLPVDEEWFRWGRGQRPTHLGGWAGQAVRDYAAATTRVFEMRRDLALWDAERPSGFPDADLMAVNVVAMTIKAKRFSREPFYLKQVGDLCEHGEVRRILHPWMREVQEHTRSLVWSLGQAARHQPEHALMLAGSWDTWSHHLGTAWTTMVWGLPVEFHLGGPLETPLLRLLGLQLLVEMAQRNDRLHFREGLLEEALGRFRVVVEEFPPGSEGSGHAITQVLKLVCRELPAADRVPELLATYAGRIDALEAPHRAIVAYLLARVLEFRHQVDRLPPGYVDQMVTRMQAMVVRLKEDGYGASSGSEDHRVLGAIEKRLEIFTREAREAREAASGAGG